MVTIAEFRTCFSKAEEDIKYAELSIGSIESGERDDCEPGADPRGVVVPSINELRYAAKHISDALDDGMSVQDKDVQIDKAIRHCVRARLDALKATIIFLSQHFHRFSQDYSLCTLPDKIRNRQNEIREKFIDALRSISQNHSKKTDEECDFLREKIRDLHGFYLEVEKQRDVFNQILYETRKRDDKLFCETRKHDKTSAILWAAGVIISAIFTIFGILIGLCF